MTEFEPYLKDIGIDTVSTISRLADCYNIVSKFCPEVIKTIFISEYRNTEYSSVLESVHLISDNFIMEIKHPLSTDFSWDITKFTSGFFWVEVQSTSFDYVLADNSSRLTIKTHAKHINLHSEFKASSKNCHYLVKIYNDIIKPNISE